jgi:hypothetical protein
VTEPTRSSSVWPSGLWISAASAAVKFPLFALNRHGARAAIPPRKDAKIWQHANTKGERQVRDENLRRIRKVGRKEWKRESNYHRRSLAETQVFRFKTIFGDRLQTRRIDNQFKELMLKSAILNRMAHLGMPDSVKVVG